LRHADVEPRARIILRKPFERAPTQTVLKLCGRRTFSSGRNPFFRSAAGTRTRSVAQLRPAAAGVRLAENNRRRPCVSLWSRATDRRVSGGGKRKPNNNGNNNNNNNNNNKNKRARSRAGAV
jgi:hypothetical protein